MSALPAAPRPRVVAHRGMHAEARGGPRENTLAAVLAAVDAGVGWVEIDVRVTADGIVVLLHDDTLERLWGDPRAIARVPLEQARALGRGERRIPVLADVLDALHGLGVTLLIDMDDADVARPAHDVVAAAGADVAIAWCGAPAAMARIRDRDADAAIWTAWYSADPPGRADLDGVTVLNMQHTLVGPAMVRAVHDHGAEIAIWTLDDGDRAVELAALGVDSITTNGVGAIRAALGWCALVVHRVGQARTSGEEWRGGSGGSRRRAAGSFLAGPPGSSQIPPFVSRQM